MNAAVQNLEIALEALRVESAKLLEEAQAIVAQNELTGALKFANGAQQVYHKRNAIRNQIRSLNELIATF